MKGKQRCKWHWLLSQGMDIQELYAEKRLKVYRAGGEPDVARRPKSEWPEGKRWCSGCQSYVPLFYVGGSRCKACDSKASHRARVEKVYGIEAADYDRLFELQGGRCFICQRRSPSRRLAVDHDHESGEVRGLLCPDPDRGCNHAILGNIKDLAMARRIVEYLEDPPMERLRRGEKPPRPPAEDPWRAQAAPAAPPAAPRSAAPF